jgi:hypothetical protein
VTHLPTGEAVRLLGLPNTGAGVARFFRLTAKHGVTPVLEAPGKRGAKFWATGDIRRLRALLDIDEVAS